MTIRSFFFAFTAIAAVTASSLAPADAARFRPGHGCDHWLMFYFGHTVLRNLIPKLFPTPVCHDKGTQT